GQAAVELGLVAVLEHVHHVRAAHARGVVQRRLLEPPLLQLADALLRVVDHVLLRSERDRTGRAGLHARGLQAHRNAVGAERALIRLVVLLRDARDVERAAGDAVAAADAVLLIEVYDAVRVLHDRPRRRAGLEAARLGAVHAAVLADQPLQRQAFRLALDLGEAHQRPGAGVEVGGIVVDPDVVADFRAQLVPLHARDLAGLAADALGLVDELGDFLGLADARRRRGGGRPGLNVER